MAKETKAMTYPERIEAIKVALKQAFIQQHIDPWSGFSPSTAIPPIDWEPICRAADAACIKALEKPTPAMAEIGWHSGCPEHDSLRDIVTIWHVMWSKIDRT